MTLGTYIRAVIIETDTWLSVLTGGTAPDTISLRVARACHNGGHTACFVCWVLGKIVEKGHCTKILAGQSTQGAAALKAGVYLAIAFALVVYGWQLFL